MALPSATDVEYLGTSGSGGTVLGQATDEKIGFYGVTPITQRAGAAQATSLVGTASSTAITTDVKAAIIEIMNAIDALNLWKGSA